MHHLLLFLPILALLLFAYLPFKAALPLYLIILFPSLVGYWKALKAQRQPQVMGEKAMIGQPARVVAVHGDRSGQADVGDLAASAARGDGSGSLAGGGGDVSPSYGAEVEYQGEVWQALSKDALKPGDRVVIEDVSGLTLKVKRSPIDETRLS